MQKVMLVNKAGEEIGTVEYMKEIVAIECDDEGNVIGGEASMESYLQAWHERTDEKVWIFIGTYIDRVRFVPGRGWQIYDMQLKPVGGETRYMDAAVGMAS